jgi:hypothetical protein
VTLPLLPDRDCGGCVECCRFIPLDLPELAKPTGELCAYCVDGAGCGVHAIRPQTCRTWFCVWRMVELSDDWRPDRSGVIVRPDGLTTGEITLYVVRDTDFLRSDDLFQTLAGWIDNGIALALSRPGPVGTLPVRAVVTDYLGPALRSGDRAMFDLLLRNALDSLDGHDWQADGITARYAVEMSV